MKGKKRHYIKKSILYLSAALLCFLICISTFFGIKGYMMYKEAISQTPIEDTVNTIRSEEHFTKYSELPDFYINAVISVEDHRFMKHPGFDLIAICRAALADIRSLSFKEGGSTITQQLVKNLFYTQDKTLERKTAEIFAVLDMEGKYSKEEIFELYVNTINFGSGYHGIYYASIGYFEKEPSELTNFESAILAGLPNAPSEYSPDTNTSLTSQRTQQVLDSMVRNRLLTQDEANNLRALWPGQE